MVRDAVCSNSSAMLFGPKPWIFSNSSAVGGYTSQHLIASFEAAALLDLLEHRRDFLCRFQGYR